jgi:hypothetical protein
MKSYKEIAQVYGVSKWTIQRKIKHIIPVMKVENGKERINLFTEPQYNLILEYLDTTKLGAKRIK